MRLLFLLLPILLSVNAQSKGKDHLLRDNQSRYSNFAKFGTGQVQSNHSESMRKDENQSNNSHPREEEPKYQDLSDMLHNRRLSSKLSDSAGSSGRQSNPMPATGQQPVINVTIQLNRVDVEDDGVELEITYRQEWIEPQFVSIEAEKFRVTREFLDTSLWEQRSLVESPSHSVSKSFIATVSQSDGKFVVEETIVVQERCTHKAGAFPSDTLTCTSLLDLHQSHKLQEDGEMGLKARISRPFEIESVQFRRNEKFEGGDWLILSMEIVVRRHAATYYWFSSVHPTLFFLILTWTSLFLDRVKFLTHRLCISLISLLAVMTLSVVTNSAGRSFEQGNVLDIWFRFSSLLIFIVLIVNVVITILSTWKREETDESPYSTKQETSDVEKLPKAMEYLIKVFYPIIAILILFYVFIKI